MEKGLKNTIKTIVTETNTAKAIGSGTLDVFATPAMIALIEETAWKSVQNHLEEGQSTVGSSLDIKHISPTPLGHAVSCTTELVEIEGKKLVFKAVISDDKCVIGTGLHTRYIINNDKFMDRAKTKPVTSE
ncbi:MAG: thioesterase family protein [Prevotella sp.]